LAGRPAGWLAVVEPLVAAASLNVNRRGVVFIPTMADRDIDALAHKVATCSRAAYLSLLDRAGDRGGDVTAGRHQAG
jgi:hypothetical protein